MTKRRMRWLLAALSATSLLLLGTCVHRIVDGTRGTPLAGLGDRAQPPAVSDTSFTTVAGVLSNVTFLGGNRVEVLTDADTTFARLFRDLRNARSSILVQSYYCLPGGVLDTFQQIVAERARAGVRVLVLADGFGCRRLVREYGRELRQAGVELEVLRPVRWYTLHEAQHRSHVRIFLIDGAVAYTGGIGLDDKWLHGEEDSGAWRDTSVRFSGPTVLQAQAAFFSAWSEATGVLHLPFPVAATTAPGTAIAGVQYHIPGMGTTSGERLLLITLAAAGERLFIANAYFLPNAAQRRALRQAARRGVDVRVLTAGPRSDVPTTRFAARGHYAELLDSGVRVYEYAPSMMHAKTIVADGLFGMVGSMNFDNRSLRIDDELNLLIYDTAVAGRMEASFLDDLTRSVEITTETHGGRGRVQRILERAARWVQPLL
jgi:cardiolipin synthase A/B